MESLYGNELFLGQAITMMPISEILVYNSLVLGLQTAIIILPKLLPECLLFGLNLTVASPYKPSRI